jgi:DNA-binding NtrC family response regulator
VSLQVPPLAERDDDVLTLAEHFLVQAAGGAKCFDDGARAALMAYAWPGNVRELKHRVETAALFDENDRIGRQALGLPVPGQAAKRDAAADGSPAVRRSRDDAADQQERAALEHDLWSLIVDEGMTLAQAMGRCEQLMIRAALRAEGDNRTRAAGRLGIHVRTIFKKLP